MVENNKNLLKEALKLCQTGKLTASAALCHKILEEQSDNIDAVSLLGTLNLLQGNLDTACMFFRKTLELRPDYAMAHCNLGSVHQATGKFDKAITSYKQAIALKPDYVDAYYNLGYTLQASGQLEEAILSYKQAIALKPDDAKIYGSLANVLREKGKTHEALINYRQSILFNPHDARLHNNLGAALQELDKLDEAITSYKQAIALKPDYAECHNNMGTALSEQDKFDEAMECFDRAIKLKPNYADAYSNLGIALKNANRIEEAITNYKLALEINPELVTALSNLAELWEKKNCLDDAQSTVDRGLELAPMNPSLNFVAAKLERYQGRYQNAIKRLGKIENAGKFNVRIQFLLGQLKNQIGNNSEAFNHFVVGNRLASEKASRNNVNKDIYSQEIDKLIEYFKQNEVSSWANNPVFESEDNPVFLIGFPRSGTTLLGQILDSHPRLQVLEEKPTMEILQKEINKPPNCFPNALANLTQEQIIQLRTLHNQEVSKYIQRQNGTILVVKYPLYISLTSLIWRIFPQAKIILAVRHPCDVCLSCFMQDFKVNEAMANFFTIKDAANLYSKVMELWRRYEQIFPLDYHIIKYEDIVVNFESEIMKIMDFLEIEWSDNVRSYNEHARKQDLISTPSYHQVTKHIYQHASYRWQKYAEQLNPIMETLKPFVEYFGYSIEGSK